MTNYQCPQWCVTDHEVPDDDSAVIHYGRPSTMGLLMSALAGPTEKITVRLCAISKRAGAPPEPAHLQLDLDIACQDGFDLSLSDARMLVALLESAYT